MVRAMVASTSPGSRRSPVGAWRREAARAGAFRGIRGSFRAATRASGRIGGHGKNPWARRRPRSISRAAEARAESSDRVGRIVAKLSGRGKQIEELMSGPDNAKPVNSEQCVLHAFGGRSFLKVENPRSARPPRRVAETAEGVRAAMDLAAREVIGVP